MLHMKVDKVSDEEDDKVAKGTLVNVVSQVNLAQVGGSNSRSCSCTPCMILHFARFAHCTLNGIPYLCEGERRYA